VRLQRSSYPVLCNACSGLRLLGMQRADCKHGARKRFSCVGRLRGLVCVSRPLCWARNECRLRYVKPVGATNQAIKLMKVLAMKTETHARLCLRLPVDSGVRKRIATIGLKLHLLPDTQANSFGYSPGTRTYEVRACYSLPMAAALSIPYRLCSSNRARAAGAFLMTLTVSRHIFVN
jgi:hypothetical protein